MITVSLEVEVWKLFDLVPVGSVADPDAVCHFDADADSDPACQFDADPDPTFHFDAVPVPDQNLSFQIKAQNREKVSCLNRLIFHTFRLLICK